MINVMYLHDAWILRGSIDLPSSGYQTDEQTDIQTSNPPNHSTPCLLHTRLASCFKKSVFPSLDVKKDETNFAITSHCINPCARANEKRSARPASLGGFWEGGHGQFTIHPSLPLHYTCSEINMTLNCLNLLKFTFRTF